MGWSSDTLGGVPVAVTYSGAVFDRRVAGQVLSFGTSGRVMYHRQTESLCPSGRGAPS